MTDPSRTKNSQGSVYRTKRLWRALFLDSDGRYHHEKLRTLIFAAATLIGGLWALHIFIRTQVVELSELEIRRYVNDLDKAKRADIPYLEFSYQIEQFAEQIEEDLGHGVIVHVEVTNKGWRTAEFNFEKLALLTVARVKSVGKKLKYDIVAKPRYVRLFEDRDDSWIFVTIEPGAKKVFPFVCSDLEPGLYYVQFKALIPGKDEQFIREKSGIWDSDRPPFWSGSRYFQIP